MKRLLLLAVCFSGVIVVQASEVFNSTNEFSVTQGQNGWSYGYYDGDSISPYTPTDFEEFPQSINGNQWIVNRDDRSGYWTSMYAVGGHPNGPNANYYQGTEHWTVRRWVSDESGTLLIEGFIRKSNSTYGDGINASIFLNDSIIFSERRPGNDPQGIEYSLQIEVQAGDIIDFAIAPVANDLYDSTIFTAVGTLQIDLESPVIAFDEPMNDKGCVEATSSSGTVVTAYVENFVNDTNVVYIWSTQEGEMEQGSEFSFHVALGSNTIVFLTAVDELTGDTEASFQIVRVCDSIPPTITIEERKPGSNNLNKPLNLDITVYDDVDGPIPDFIVCMGKTSEKTLDPFTGGASIKIQNPLIAAQWKTIDVTVIASDASGNTAVKTVQVTHKKTAPKKEPQKKKSTENKFRWNGWRNR